MAKTIKSINHAFKTYLQLKDHIVGVKHLKDEVDYHDHTFKEHKYPMYYCYMVKEASRGKSIKSSHQGMACETSSKVIGLEPYYGDDHGPKDWYDIDVFHSMSLAKNKHEALKPASRKKGIALGPLKDFIEQPDTLIFIVNPYQMMRLMQGYHYHYKEDLSLKMSGQCGVCYESTMYPYDSHKMNISALCSGTRFICKWPDDVMMVSMPFTMVENILEGIIQTCNPCELDRNKINIKKEIGDSIKLKSNYFKS